MTTRIECFLSNKWPVGSSLHADVIALGIAESGFKPPRTYFRDGRVYMDNLFAVFDELDARISAWVPLCLNWEHAQYYLKNNGPISSRGFVALQTHVVGKMKERYQRLISAWGQPYGIHVDEAEASRLYTCAAIGAYWKEGNTVGSYLYNSRERYEQAQTIIDEQRMDEMHYVSPTEFPPRWQDGGAPLNDARWGTVLDYCEERKAMKPRATFSFWQNRDVRDHPGFTDAYLLARITEMKERLG